MSAPRVDGRQVYANNKLSDLSTVTDGGFYETGTENGILTSL